MNAGERLKKGGDFSFFKYDFPNYGVREERVGEKFKGDIWEHHCVEWNGWYTCTYTVNRPHGGHCDINIIVDKETLVVLAVPDWDE